MSGDDGPCPSACFRRVAGGAHPPRPRFTRPGTSIGSSGRSPATKVARSSPGTNGKATGYAAFLGLDLQHHKAVVLCTDVAGGH
jgi:hypothetical protein